MTDWTGITEAAPATEPVTLEELKTFCRIDGSTFDTMLTGYITACRQAVERLTGRNLINRAVTLYFDEFPAGFAPLYLPRPPVQSVTSITYIDPDGTSTVMPGTDYRADLASVTARIAPALDAEWPATAAVINAVSVVYVSGYGTTAASVPAALRECIKSLAADLFEHPEANAEMTLTENRTYKFLLNAYTNPGVV